MEVSNLNQKFKENKLLRYGTIIPVLIILALVFFLVKSWFAPRNPQFPPGLRGEIIGYWAFEEKEQEIIDAKGQNSGQLGSSIQADEYDPTRTGGKFGSALKLTGEDYALVPYDDKFDLEKEVSLEAWVKPQGSSANENLWLPGWKYRKRIIVENDDIYSFENTQVKLVLNTKKLIGNNKLQSECQDLRFTKADKTTKLNWYIEEGCNSTTTEVWVKVPYLEEESVTPFYFYYGNFDASSTNNFKSTMEVPPVKSWKWPLGTHWMEEKISSMTIRSDDTILVGGYQEDQTGPGQEWKALKVNPEGRTEGYRIYSYSDSSNQINDVALTTDDKSILAGFDTGPGDSQWRVKRRGFAANAWDYTVNPSSGSDRITAVARDNEGNVIIGGFDNSPGNAQWRVEKLNSEGKKLWEYTNNPSSALDVIKDMAIDSQNNILVAGVDKERGNDQWRLEKISPGGSRLRAYLLDTSNGSDVLNEVEVNSKDEVIIGGYDFKEGNARWSVIKLDSDLEPIWKYSSNPSSGSDQISGLAIDEYDNIIVGGHDYSSGNAQWRVEKLNSEGEKIWEYTDNPTPGMDVIGGVGIDSNDDIVLAGTSGAETPEHIVQKLSEKKHYNFKPEFKVGEESTFTGIPSLLVGKLGSYSLRLEGGEVKGEINDNLVSGTISNNWNHVLLTYDGSEQKLYINSQLKASQALTGNINKNYNNILIGFNFAGLLDEVRIYNKALTSDEVEQVYQHFQK